jgi:ribosomal protein S18 acetylase RimI-like enzyme
MVHYRLKKATPADSQFFYDVKKTVLRGYIEKIWGWDEAFQIQFYNDNYRANDCSIIYVNNIPAGTVEIKEDEKQIFISSLYLLPGYQRRRIGTAIINDCLKRAEADNKRVALEVLKINLHAQRLYSKLGFALKDKDETKFYMYKDCTNEQDKRIV